MTENSATSAQIAPPVGGFQEIDGCRIFVHRSGSGGPAKRLLSDTNHSQLIVDRADAVIQAIRDVVSHATRN